MYSRRHRVTIKFNKLLLCSTENHIHYFTDPEPCEITVNNITLFTFVIYEVQNHFAGTCRAKSKPPTP